MSSAWFLVPVVIDDEGGRAPDLGDVRWRGVLCPNAPRGVGKWLVRVYADEAELDALAKRSEVVRLPDPAAGGLETAFAQRTGLSLSKQQIEQRVFCAADRTEQKG